MEKRKYAVEIQPLTGVHIGSGNELTLFDYAVKNITSKKEIYIKYSSEQILNRLMDSKEEKEDAKKKLIQFAEVDKSKDLKRIYKFFHDNICISQDVEYPCDITASFLHEYRNNKEKDPIENASIVLQMYRPAGSKKPVIPGSSLKGAIRTAVLNKDISLLSDEDFGCYQDALKQETQKKNSDLELQHKVWQYHDAKDDPFRAVQIADTVFDAKNTQIVGRLDNISAATDHVDIRKTGMQIQAEIIRGLLMDGAAKACTIITLDTPLQDINMQNGCNSCIKKKISIKDIQDACNDFFMDEFEDEYDQFYRKAIDHTDIITKLKSELEAVCATENSFIIRVGRWSQIEFVTVEEALRKPSTRLGKSGTTRTVFDYNGNYVPLGWCKCTYKEVVS